MSDHCASLIEASSSTSGSQTHTLKRNQFRVKRKATGLRCFYSASALQSSGLTVTETPTLFCRYLQSSLESSSWICSGPVQERLMRGAQDRRQVFWAALKGGSSIRFTLQLRGGLRELRYFIRAIIIATRADQQAKQQARCQIDCVYGCFVAAVARWFDYRMQRLQAENKFNLQPLTCPACRTQQPNYRFLILNNQAIRCFNCTNTPHLLKNIQAPLKEYYYDIIKRLPIPDCKIAKACLDSLGRLRLRASELMGEIKAKILTFEQQLEGFLKQTQIICETYVEKLKQLEESKVEDWHSSPPKLIDQERYIVNIKQKHQAATLIAASLKDLQIRIPSIAQLKKQAFAASELAISPKNCLTAAINARGSLYLGANDGQLFYEHDFSYKSIQAHESLIRAFEHDGQFRLFSGSDDYKIKMWDIHGEPQHLRTFGSIEGIKSYHRQLTLLEGGRFLASSRGQFDDYQIRIWDLSNFSNPRTLSGHDGYIRSMIIDGSGRIVSASEDRYLRVWDAKSCELLKEYFHSGKILFLFAHAASQAYCIIDDKNRLLLLDQDSLLVFQAVNIGRKVVSASAGNWIYLHIDRYIMIYSWALTLEEKVDLGSNWTSTNIIQMGSVMYVTDAHGVLHQLHPNTLAKN